MQLVPQACQIQGSATVDGGFSRSSSRWPAQISKLQVSAPTPPHLS
jgi:hypothetical protein